MTSKILVVEDEAKIRSLLVEELTDEGYELESAENGEEGLEKIASCRPDLILCDVSMPKMGGFELLKRFRDEHPDQAQTPFLFLTAFGDRDAQIEARKLGVDDFLTKPVDFELLMVAIQSHLEKQVNTGERHNKELVRLYQKMASDPDTPAGRSADQPTVVSGGRVVMLGLRDIKAELGPDWEQVAHRVTGMAENVISKHLPEGCTYESQGEDGFAICFEGLGEAEASGIVETIKQNIRKTVDAAQQSGDFSQLVADEAVLDGVGSVQSDVYEFKVNPDQAAKAGDLMALVTNSFAGAEEDLANSAVEMLRDTLANASATERPVQSTDGRPVSFVMLDIDPDHHRRLQKIRNSLSDDRKLMCELDIARFGLTSQYVLDNAYDKPAGVITFINFSTITDRASASRFFEMCRNVPELVKNSVVFVVDNIPADTHDSIIQDAVRSLNPVCRGCFLKVDRPAHSAVNISGQLVTGVYMDYPDFASGVLVRDDAKRRFFNSLKSMGTDLLVDGLRKKSELLKIKEVPVRYFSIAT